jgi:tetratricopeptide (TPR) repeat protein
MWVLCDYGLVGVDTPLQELIESRGYSIHGCVHSWTIHVLNREWDYDLARVAVEFVGSYVPEQEAIQPWLTQRRLLQHAARCSDILLSGLVTDEEGMAWTYYNLGDLYADQDKLAEAEQMYKRALRGYEKALGAKHTSTLGTINNLGLLYANQGKLAEAEQMYERALQGYEKALGLEDKTIPKLNTINNLGLLYADQGKLAEAEQMYERALQGYEKALGAKHTSTLDTVNNLGLLYTDQGKLAEAEQMYQRALQGYEKALGPEDKAIPKLNTIYNLGLLYAKQGKLAEAEQMYSRALAGYEKVVGPDHPSSRRLPGLLQALDTKWKVEEPVNNSLGETSRLGAKRAPFGSKRYKLLKKLGLR